MEQKLEQILKDIYALEPDLRERDGEVRALVRELLLVRPNVTLDPNFAASLRERVLAEVAKPVTVPHAPARRDALWWALRIAPIGAFAALTLALIGGLEGLEEPLTPEMISDGFVTQTAPAPMNARTPTPGGGSEIMLMKSTPKSAPGGMGGGANGDAMDSDVGNERSTASDAALMMDYAEPDADLMMDNSIFVANQLPGSHVAIESITLGAAGHVRIFAYEDGAPRAVLGTTGVLPAGANSGVSVALSRAVSPGETLYAQLFASNGDDIFTPYEDEPIHDASGELIYVIFMIDSR